MTNQSKNSGNGTAQSAGRNIIKITEGSSYHNIINGATHEYHNNNVGNKQNFWISLSIIGTISIATLLGTASLIFHLTRDREPVKTGLFSQSTLFYRSSQTQ